MPTSTSSTRIPRLFTVAEYGQALSDAPLITPFYSPEGDRILFASSRDELVRALRAADISHILVNRDETPSTWSFLVHQPSFLHWCCTIEHAAGGVYLYRLREQVPADGQSGASDDAWRRLER